MKWKRINNILPVILLLLIYIFPLASKSVFHHHEFQHYHLYGQATNTLYQYERPCPICNYEIVTFMPASPVKVDDIVCSRPEEVFSLVSSEHASIPLYISLRAPPVIV